MLNKSQIIGYFKAVDIIISNGNHLKQYFMIILSTLYMSYAIPILNQNINGNTEQIRCGQIYI